MLMGRSSYRNSPGSAKTVPHSSKEKILQSVRTDSMAEQPRALALTQPPNCCHQLGKLRLEGQSRLGDKARLSEWPLGSSTTNIPLPGLETCWLQCSPHSHLLSSCTGPAWITNQCSQKGRCVTCQWLCPGPQGLLLTHLEASTSRGAWELLFPLTSTTRLRPPGPPLAALFLGPLFLDAAGLPAATNTEDHEG